MTVEAWLLLAAILLLDTGSHLLLKSASMKAGTDGGPLQHLAMLLSQSTLWLAIASFVALFFAWIGFISVVPLSQGVMAGSITIVGVMLGGRIFFGEAITAGRAGSIGLIAFGVLLVGLGA